MPSVAQALRTSEQVRSEIEQAFGFFPPFFEPALASPQVLENLWQQTLSAYIANPLSALFKEKLNALLSRFCTAPYCIIVHSSALRPLGMTAPQVLALLDTLSSDLGAALPLGGLSIPTSEEAAAPASDSLLEKTLLYCATSVFLERADAPACQAELRRLLGPDLYPHLVAYLAYIETCHTWIEAHPEVSHEADRRAQDNLGPLLAEEPALGDFFRHYQERVRAQGLGRERRRAADETLRAEQARTSAILESITDAFFALDADWRFTYVNAQAERLLLRPRAELLGRNVWTEFPAAVGSEFDRQYHHAVSEQSAVTFEAYYPPPLDTWFEVRAFPSPKGLSVFFHDITERVERGRRERFLADLAERARSLADPEEVIADAVRSVGEFLGVSRCLFADIDIEADTCSVRPHYRADNSVTSIAGVFPISAFGPFVIAEYKAGRTAVVDDVRADRVKVPPESLAAYEAIGVRAYVAAPVLHSTRLVSALAVHSPVPRHWKAEEVELLQTVVERTWLTVEVTRQARALVREAEERREAGERTARILEGITDAFFTIDREWHYTYINRQVEALWGRTREELLGMTVWEAWPEAVGSTFDHQFHRALSESVPVSFEEFFPPLDAWLEVRINPSPDGLSVFFQNVTERKAAAEALRRSQEDLRLATDAARLGTFYCDYPLDKIVWNDTCKRHFFLPPDAEVDFTLFYSLLHPDDREPTRRAIAQAMEGRVAYDVEYRTLAPDGRTRWVNAVGRFYYAPDGAPTRFDGITIDISARRAAEDELHQRTQRERFLADLAERARSLTDPDAVIADAVNSVGEFLGVSRCVFADIDIAADTCTVPPDYLADGTVASMAGTFPISAFGPFLVGEYGAGRTVVAEDVNLDPVRFPAAYVGAYRAVGIRAFVAVPVLHSSRLVSVIAAHSAAPRQWKAEEVELLRTVVERTWLTVEVTRQERALVREAEERREAHQRTATILESITGAFYALNSQWRFSYVNHQAEALWGRSRPELLGQPFLAVFPDARGSFPFAQHERVMAARVPAHFETLSPILGRWVEVNIYPTADGGLSVFFHDISARRALEDERSRFVSLADNSTDFIGMSDLNDVPFYVNPAGLRLVGLADMDQARQARGIEFFHEDDRPFLLNDLVPRVLRDGHGQAEVRLRHFGTGAPIWVNYTLFTLTDGDGRPVGLATVSRDITERKALEAERERLAEREHNIAQQLQTALQPEVPRAVPGLRLAKYYEAALAESEGVGGDFYDVFAVEKGCTMLVVGDLSGKGLAAAAQVATVRNMLRAFLYTRTTLAEAVTELNAVLAENGLLTGFTTLFVAAYDAGEHTLRYVNCGQEPALVRRGATGHIEHLPPTGPILGTFEGGRYAEATVTLGRGDALAIFSDGLTEIGPSRLSMLGVEGVEALFGQPVPNEEASEASEMAERLALNLIAGVDAAAAGGVMRDDVCLLVAVVE